MAELLNLERAGAAAIRVARAQASARQVPGQNARSGDALRSGPAAEQLPVGVAPFTDLGNAHRLEQEHGRDLRFARGLGWLVYDGRRFEEDATGAAERRMHSVARGMLERSALLTLAAAREPSKERSEALQGEAKAFESWAKKSQHAQRLQSGLAVASSLESIACSPEDFDPDGWALNVQSGSINLRTGTIGPHNRADMLTRLAPTAFTEAACPAWLAFLEKVFAGDQELIGFVRRAVGYCLTGSTAEQCFFVCHGMGANGKSTLLETLRFVLGDYAMTTGTDTFMRARDGRGPENDVARLRGARFVSAVESGEGRKLDEERIKRLTGGDTVTARFLYREAFEFVPQFKIWLAVNDKPEITGTDLGIWRRVRLIPFNVTIPEREQDRELGAKLRAEASGILHWAVQGCLEWQREGLKPPDIVTAATTEWRHTANVAARFVDEACTRGDGLSVKVGALYGAFQEWAKHQGEEAVSAKAFTQRLKALGFAQERTKTTRTWRGLAANGTQDAGDGRVTDDRW